MKPGRGMVAWAADHPKALTSIMIAVTIVLIAAVALPSLWPSQFGFLHSVAVDTDPENMLSEDEEVRVFHDRMKKMLALHDMVVVGVVNESHPQGVFNRESLARVYELTEYAKTLRGEAINEEDPQAGVVEVDLIAPSTVDNMEQGGLGVVRFEWLMPEPPESDEAALAIREKAQRLPFLDGTLLSEDGKALAIYLPLTAKDLSYKVYSRLQKKIAEFSGDDQFYITGLPVAEDTFGVEMFKQMAISAPLAMLVIFILMLVFFRKLVLVISPMIIAMVSVIFTMGMLVVTGNTIHIMSSMIPIFIMPIAVLDSIHILSEFFDRYQQYKDRRETIRRVMDTLYMPMLFTSLTSAAGFGSLALTPIPPVQVFGVFVSIGVLMAWLLTVLFVPAYVMLIPERAFKNFGAVHHDSADVHEAHGFMGKILHFLGEFTYVRAKLVLAGAAVAVVVAAYGISQININDNPTKWFEPDHPIRVADRVLNEHFGGTYMAYLTLKAPEQAQSAEDYAQAMPRRLAAFVDEAAAVTPEVRAAGEALAAAMAPMIDEADSAVALRAKLRAYALEQADAAEGDARYGWEELVYFFDQEAQRSEIFKEPEALRYIEGLQAHLAGLGTVGKSNSLADLVKTVHRELFEGETDAFRIPDTNRAVAQCLITFESSHRPHDLYHFVTPDYTRTSLWVQLKTGDNRDMSQVVAAVDEYVAANPPPFALEHDWFGLTYINVIWQEKMVSGMLEAFLGSFLVVLIMMTVLFRSGLWGLLSMIPLTITIGLIYGVIGLIGKDYDMPVAVLSSLTLGLAVDFAIHFLARAKAMYPEYGSWDKTHGMVFGEPARAIVRNVVVIAVGFLPLIAAPLVPYKTVGVFLAAILALSGVATLLILPALMRYLERGLFPQTERMAFTCRFGTTVLVSAASVALVDVNLHQFAGFTWPEMLVVSVPLVLIMAAVGWFAARRQSCRPAAPNKPGQPATLN